MDDRRFEVLVGELEQRAAQDPEAYRWKVMALARAGNCYVGLVLVGLAGATLYAAIGVGTVSGLALRLSLMLGLLLWVLIKALWVRLPEPEGREIKAQDAPALFALIADLQQALRTAPVDKVLLTAEFNAAVVQTPRWGPLGGPTHTCLMLGLPLMQLLSAEQFKAVLAHEFGHIKRGDGEVSSWIYCQRRRWQQLVEVLEQRESVASLLFKPFFRWFAPFFNAYSFPMARADEYAADAAAARLTTSRVMAQTLTSVCILGRLLEQRYWPAVYRQAETQREPGVAPYAALRGDKGGWIAPGELASSVENAMAEPTGVADTHPSLADRLRALGEEPSLALPEGLCAADELLGVSAVTLTAAFDQQWTERIAEAWTNRFEQSQRARARLDELRAKCARAEPLDTEELLDLVYLLENLAEDPEAALGFLRNAQQAEATPPAIAFALGIRLLARGDEAARALIEQAIAEDASLAADGNRLLAEHYLARGETATAQPYQEHYAKAMQRQGEIEYERNNVTLGDHFSPHGISDSALAELRGQLAHVPGLHKAFLVRKETKLSPAQPLYVLAFCVTPFYRLHRPKRAHEVLREIQARLRFPGETIIVNIEGRNFRFGLKIRWMIGARVK